MAVSVQKNREIVFQLLYSHSFVNSDAEAIIPLLMKQHSISRKSARKIVEEASRIWDEADHYDREIEKYSYDFPIEKIGRVERALLRQAIGALHDGEVPPKVVIAEAIRLSKKFATPESGAFVNALLDATYKGREDAPFKTESTTI